MSQMNSTRAQAVVRVALRSPVARERDYQFRSYQLQAGLAAYRTLRRRRTALLTGLRVGNAPIICLAHLTGYEQTYRKC
jgi:hypothetical protein